MILQRLAGDKTQTNAAIETSIDIGLMFLLGISCYLIVRPFVPLVAWGVIIAVAAYPNFRKLERALGGRTVLSAVLFTAVFLGLFILPMALLAETLVDGAQTLTAHIKAGTLTIPPPPASVATWPLIGARLSSLWASASSNLAGVIKDFLPQIRGVLPEVFSASAGIGLTVLQFALSIVVAGAILANADGAYQLARSLANRIFDEKGPEFQELIGNTVRSVTNGILGVALIQTVLAGIGFIAAGLPGAGLWTVMFLFAAVMQVGLLVLIPAVVYMFAISSTTSAIIFMVWCGFVGTIDNVLKPLLLGRGAAVPIVIVFLGAIGGFMAMGIIGLFIGAIVLSVGYKLVVAWLDQSPSEAQADHETLKAATS